MTTAHLAVKPLLIITLYMRPHSSLSVTGRVRASQSLAAFEPYRHLAAFEPYSYFKYKRPEVLTTAHLAAKPLLIITLNLSGLR